MSASTTESTPPASDATKTTRDRTHWLYLAVIAAVLLGIAIGLIVCGVVGALLSIPILAFSKSFIQDLSRMHDDVLPTGELDIGNGHRREP